MHPIIAKTFGGLSKPYFFRHFFFSCIFFLAYLYIAWKSPGDIQISTTILFVVNTLLYPYSRFVYESVVNFIVGNNLFVIPAFLMLFVKLMTMMLCFMAAIFIAPIGFAYLYYYHTKQAKQKG